MILSGDAIHSDAGSEHHQAAIGILPGLVVSRFRSAQKNYPASPRTPPRARPPPRAGANALEATPAALPGAVLFLSLPRPRTLAASPPPALLLLGVVP